MISEIQPTSLATRGQVADDLAADAAAGIASESAAFLSAGPAASTSAPAARFSRRHYAAAQHRLNTLRTFREMVEAGKSRTEAIARLGVAGSTIWKWQRRHAEAGFNGLLDRTHNCGRHADSLPTDEELAAVRAVYLRLNESRVRGRGRGSSRVTAYRYVAKTDPQVSEHFRHRVLGRAGKTLPKTWLRLLDTPSAVLAATRDQSSTLREHISTPRGLTYINAAGEEAPLRAGAIFESDDGTVNFPVCIPWPYGGDPCSDKFGVKLGRFQLLPVVDRRSRMCVFFHYVIRAKSSYRGEDVVALMGSCFADVGMPQALCLERGSWESNIVKDALAMTGVRVVRAWEPKQKNAVENFFDRLWTPLSLLPGDVGRTRGENVDATDLVMRCAAGRADPREHFLDVAQAVEGIGRAVSFVNSEPIESRHWGRWIPQQLFVEQGGRDLPKLPEEMRLFFSREQRTWTVRAGCVGAAVETPGAKFPVYFQPEELWAFNGCKVKVFFDPFVEPVRGTIVLENAWRTYMPGHVIARDVPALELPPQAVLAVDWQRSDELEEGLRIRRAMARAVRTEKWSWLGHRSSEARDGLGNVSRFTTHSNHERAASGPELPHARGGVTSSRPEISPPRTRRDRAAAPISFEELAELEM